MTSNYIGRSESKTEKINLSLILRKQFGPEALKWDHTEQIDKLNKITHLRLDRLNIGCIDGLELIGPKLTNLYLQCNKIEKIENLEFLPSLRFLSLAHNFISEVEGLSMLPNLGLLDLSHNSIEQLNVDELPKSLSFLNMEGNMCTHLPDYKREVTSALPRLKMLDNEMLSGDGDDDSEEEDEDGEGYEYVDSDEVDEFEAQQYAVKTSKLSPSDLKIHRNLEDMLISSQKRAEEQYDEHKHNLKLLVEYRENTQVLFEEEPQRK